MSKKVKVFVIGDCHTARIQGQHINAHLDPVDKLTMFNPSFEERNDKHLLGTNIEVNFWGLAGFKCFGMDIMENIYQNTISSPPEDAYDIPGSTDNVKIKFEFAKSVEADLIMPWMGYVDCRNWIPKYKNSELVVRDYVEGFISVFPNKKIRFIEPFPQFEELHTYNYPSFKYEVKQQANNEFIENLNKICKEKKLLPPIKQSIVYDAVNDNILKKEYARKGGEIPHKGTTIDSLKLEYNHKVYLNISEEIKKTVDLLF